MVAFDDDELRILHRELYKCGWMSEYLLRSRQSAMRKLDEYFASDLGHLRRL